jgi:hypothetical protein
MFSHKLYSVLISLFVIKTMSTAIPRRNVIFKDFHSLTDVVFIFSYEAELPVWNGKYISFAFDPNVRYINGDLL